MITIKNSTMSSRQRVAKTLCHERPDRVPVNYFANPQVNTKVAKLLKVSDDRQVVAQALGCDFKEINPKYNGPELFEQIPERKVNPLVGAITRFVENESGSYWDFCDFPLADKDEEAIAAWPVANPDDFDYDTFEESCRANKEKAIVVGHQGISDIMNTIGSVRSMENVYMDLALDNEGTMKLIERRMKSELGIFERILDRCAGDITMIWTGEDLGTQHTPLISLEMFREKIRPYHQPLVDLAKSYGIPVMIHSCGSSSWAFEDFIEMGISAVDTLQPEATNMSVEYLAEKYASRLAFHGCISTAKLAQLNCEQVDLNVRETIESLRQYNNFCLAPTHYIQDNTPPGNVLAMYKAAFKYGEY